MHDPKGLVSSLNTFAVSDRKQPKAPPASATSAASSSKAPSTPAPAVASTPAPPAAPIQSTTSSTNTVPATPTPAGSGATTAVSPSGPATSGLAMGAERAAQIAEMESMGFERSQIDAAMRAAFYNSERAIEYLLTVRCLLLNLDFV